MKIVFAHGKDGNPNGHKATKLKEEFGVENVLVPALTGLSHMDRTDVLLKAILGESDEYVLVGSSMGGATSLLALNHLIVKANTRLPKRLLLLAPVLVTPMDLCGVETAIIHGSRDTIVSLEGSRAFAKQFGCELDVVDDDHGLGGSIDLILAKLSSYLK